MTDANPDFERIAIVNRGEPAVRLINAVREYSVEHDLDLRTIALYTEPDRRAMFVREADEAFDLGPATYTDGTGQRRVGYLDYGRLTEALLATEADAVWVGWGFVAEQRTSRRSAPSSASCSSDPTPRPCEGWATRSPPNNWPSRPTCPSPDGAATRSPPPKKPEPMRPDSGIRS